MVDSGNALHAAGIHCQPQATQGQRPYLEKIGAGQHVKHHTALKYLAAQNLGKMGTLPARAAVTLSDPHVLADYHALMIPKAIEYSAGILDYFFRGRISGVVTWNNSSQEYTITVRNDSGETFGSGGTFFVMKEVVNGDRTSIHQLVLNAPLSADDTVDLTFAGPATGATKFIVVYKGTIGLNGSSASDPVDANIAMAATTLDICQTPECWIPTLQIVNQTPQFTVANLQVTSEQSAHDYWEADCALHNGDQFIWLGNGCVCFIGNFQTGQSGLSDQMVYCAYSGNLTFANVTLHPSVPWTGAPFTMLIGSNDPRIQFSPSSVLIPTGFSSDIQLTLTQVGPFTAGPIQGDLVGNCIPPAVGAWNANTTPVLSKQP